MDRYISRSYLSQKWSSVKWGMENVLRITDETAPDKVDPDDVSRCIRNITDKWTAIRNELGGESRVPSSLVPRWVPYPESPPRKDGLYLVTRGGAVRTEYFERGKFILFDELIIAWSPMPRPFSPEEDLNGRYLDDGR
jgi:hypothetical protein